MRKYIGKYRVLCERDYNGEPTGEDFTYLVGTGGYVNSKVYRYDDNKLSLLVVGRSNGLIYNTIAKMKELEVEILDFVSADKESIFIFHESDLPKVAEIISIKTSGASIQPTSLTNHPRRKQIRQEKQDSLSDEQKLERKLRGEKLSMARAKY